ncbi:splicing factor 3B subunit 4-like [Narcine bancroftii]|uniref:splicing factor 3B subunit 4-like n=1 Tax=Narcine bancroftii TaxID=1343680 RepID=UPI0038318FB4
MPPPMPPSTSAPGPPSSGPPGTTPHHVGHPFPHGALPHHGIHPMHVSHHGPHSLSPLGGGPAQNTPHRPPPPGMQHHNPPPLVMPPSRTSLRTPHGPPAPRDSRTTTSDASTGIQRSPSPTPLWICPGVPSCRPGGGGRIPMPPRGLPRPPPAAVEGVWRVSCQHQLPGVRGIGLFRSRQTLQLEVSPTSCKRKPFPPKLTPPPPSITLSLPAPPPPTLALILQTGLSPGV